MQAYIENYYQLSSAQEALAQSREDAFDKLFKTRNPNFYYKNLHKECYYFCQQYKDYFKIARAKSYKRLFSAASLLKNRIFNQCQQHKTRIILNQADFLSWENFKNFLRKNLKESDAFIDCI